MTAEIRRWRVSGRVQGVFFRASTRRRAQPLGLAGYAINLPDGSVEVAACGPVEALNELQRWLHEGPPAARVDRIERLDPPPPDQLPDSGFRTG